MTEIGHDFVGSSSSRTGTSSSKTRVVGWFPRNMKSQQVFIRKKTRKAETV